MNEETIRLQQRVDELEEKVTFLEGSLKRLAILVEPSKKYPYWHELLRLGINEGQKADLEYIMFYLTSRLNQDKEYLKHKGGEQAHRFPAELFSDELPSYHQTVSLISTVLNISQEGIIEQILLSMYQQGMFKKLIKFLIPKEISS